MDERQSHRRVVIIKDGAKLPASLCASYMRHKMLSAFVFRRDNLSLFTLLCIYLPTQHTSNHNSCRVLTIGESTVYRLFLSHPSRSLMNL